jgi:hypothetical protein
MKTGVTAFYFSLRTVILPFLFIFNTDLLLINVGWLDAIGVFIQATVAMLIFAAATQGYFFARNKLWESAALLLIAFTLFRPGYWLDMVDPPFRTVPPATIADVVAKAPDNDTLRVVVKGPDFDKPDRIDELHILLPLGKAGGDGLARLQKAAGLAVTVDGDKAVLDEPFPGSTFFTKMQGFDFYGDTPVQITEVKLDKDRMPKELFYIPALLLLGVVIVLQRRRATVPAF